MIAARRFALLGAALAVLVPVTLGASCQPRLAIVSPADLSHADPDGDVAVQIDLGAPLAAGATVTARLLRGIDAGASIVEIPLAVAGAAATAGLAAADLAPGRNALFVSVDRNGDGRADASASATFSFEPELDLSDADRCDWLDPTKCLFPFPNDRFTVADPATDTGRRVAFALEAMPVVATVHVDPTAWNENDGWSPGPKILTRVAGLDLARSAAPLVTKIARSLDADSPVVLIDADTGERQLVWSEQDPIDPSVLIVRVGKNLENGRRYIVALRGLADASGDPIPAGRGFAIYRDRIPTFHPTVEARRPAMETIFGDLARAGIARADLFLAWDFTVLSTRNLSERMLAMRDDAFASLGSAAPTFTVTRNDAFTATVRGVSRSFRRVEGVVAVPLYMTDGGEPGGRLRRSGPDGLPERDPAQDFAAPYRCTIPETATAATPGRLVLYGHGLLGSEDEVGATNIREITTAYGFVYCATKWAGMSEDDVPNVLATTSDLALFPTVTDRLHQGFLAFLFLGRAMKHPAGFAAHPAFSDASGAPIVDTSDLFYDGNSQGAIAGGGLAAFAQDYTRAVLGVTGMNYSSLLRRSVDFTPFYTLLTFGIDDLSDVPLDIALLQMLWDRVEANGVARHLTSDPLPGTPAKQVLLHVAFGDHQVANVAAEVQARSIGARIHQPALAPGRHADEQVPGDPDNRAYFAIDPLPSGPWDGSALVIWDSGTPTPPTAIVPPRPELGYGRDPHETPRRDPKAQLQKAEFLRTGGAIVDVCGGAPCTAVDP
jgi:hypothetical protein